MWKEEGESWTVKHVKKPAWLEEKFSPLTTFKNVVLRSVFSSQLTQVRQSLCLWPFQESRNYRNTSATVGSRGKKLGSENRYSIRDEKRSPCVCMPKSFLLCTWFWSQKTVGPPLKLRIRWPEEGKHGKLVSHSLPARHSHYSCQDNAGRV